MFRDRITFTAAEVVAYYRARVPRLSQRGRQWRGVCPLHQGKRFSFSVNGETGCWKCFSGCGRGGSLIDFEMVLTGADFRTALAAVYAIVGRPMPVRGRMTKEEWTAAKKAGEREREELINSFYFADAARHLAEWVLETLSSCEEERAAETKLIEDLRKDPCAVYREYCERDPKMAAALVETGRAGSRRLQLALARYLMAEVRDAA